MKTKQAQMKIIWLLKEPLPLGPPQFKQAVRDVAICGWKMD